MEGELVNCDAVGDGECVGALVGGLARQQLPQQHSVAANQGTLETKNNNMSSISPPNVAGLGKGRVPDYFGSHPRVGAGSRHARRLVHLSRQPKVCDFQCLKLQVIILNRLGQQN